MNCKVDIIILGKRLHTKSEEYSTAIHTSSHAFDFPNVFDNVTGRFLAQLNPKSYVRTCTCPSTFRRLCFILFSLFYYRQASVFSVTFFRELAILFLSCEQVLETPQ